MPSFKIQNDVFVIFDTLITRTHFGLFIVDTVGKEKTLILMMGEIGLSDL